MAAVFSSHKYAACILFTIMAAISQPGHVDAGYTMQETCAYLSSGYIGDPTNCQGWGYCQGGSLVKTGLCGDGLLYDSTIGQCNYQNAVTCSTTTENVCANSVDPGYYADPNNCNAYSYCSAGKIQQSFICPVNQVFEPSIEQCVWGTSYSCPANSICRLVQNNAFVGDPIQCGNYIRCQEGAGVSQVCTTGRFNPLKGGCDPNYSCESTPGQPGNVGPSVPAQNGTVCQQYPSTGNGLVYISDYKTCYGYYACNNAADVGKWGSCPFGTHFNGKNCVTPYTYACPWDRCGNLNLGFVAEIGCQSYSVCSNQVTVATGKCATSNPNFAFYDEYGGGCVASRPAEAICAATAVPTFPDVNA